MEWTPPPNGIAMCQLHGHETHGRTLRRLADRLGVRRIVYQPDAFRAPGHPGTAQSRPANSRRGAGRCAGCNRAKTPKQRFHGQIGECNVRKFGVE